MPLSRRDQQTADNLRAAAEHLRTTATDRPELADTVASMLTPVGQGFLNRLHADRVTTLLSVEMTKAEREYYKAAAKESGEGLSTIGDEALYEVLEGNFRPSQPSRALWGSGVSKVSVNLNLNVDKGLRDRVAKMTGLPDGGDLGWRPQGVAVLVRLYLEERFPGRPVVEEQVEQEPGRRGQLSPAEVEELVRLYEDEENPAGPTELSRRFGVSITTVHRTLDRAGVQRPSIGGNPKKRPKAD